MRRHARLRCSRTAIQLTSRKWNCVPGRPTGSCAAGSQVVDQARAHLQHRLRRAAARHGVLRSAPCRQSAAHRHAGSWHSAGALGMVGTIPLVGRVLLLCDDPGQMRRADSPADDLRLDESANASSRRFDRRNHAQYRPHIPRRALGQYVYTGFRAGDATPIAAVRFATAGFSLSSRAGATERGLRASTARRRNCTPAFGSSSRKASSAFTGRTPTTLACSRRPTLG